MIGRCWLRTRTGERKYIHVNPSRSRMLPREHTFVPCSSLRPRSGRVLKRLRMQPFLRCSDTRANRGIFLKTHHHFWVIWVSDLRKRHVTLVFRLRGNRRPGVFSTCGVRYNPNRCESNLLVLSVSDFPHRTCVMS